MNEEEKKIQKEKIKQFLQIDRASLTKNFLMWASFELQHLSMFLEYNIGTYVARYLIGIAENDDEFFVSEIHDKIINLHAFRQFWIKNSPQTLVIQIRNSPFFHHKLYKYIPN